MPDVFVDNKQGPMMEPEGAPSTPSDLGTQKIRARRWVWFFVVVVFLAAAVGLMS